MDQSADTTLAQIGPQQIPLRCPDDVLVINMICICVSLRQDQAGRSGQCRIVQLR